MFCNSSTPEAHVTLFSQYFYNHLLYEELDQEKVQDLQKRREQLFSSLNSVSAELDEIKEKFSRTQEEIKNGKLI